MVSKYLKHYVYAVRVDVMCVWGGWGYEISGHSHNRILIMAFIYEFEQRLNCLMDNIVFIFDNIA